MDSKNELQHHGILGMKWGKRNGPPYPLSGSQKSASEKAAERGADPKVVDRLQAVESKRYISDKELQERINRLQLEKRLVDLTFEDIRPGQAAAKKLIEQVGTSVVSTIAKGAILYGIKAAIGRKFDLEQFLSYITPKPKNK